jgi:hypothetical protein
MGMFAPSFSLYIPLQLELRLPLYPLPGKTSEIHRYLYSINRPSLLLSGCHNPKSTGISPLPKAYCCNLQRVFLPTFISLWFEKILAGSVIHRSYFSLAVKVVGVYNTYRLVTLTGYLRVGVESTEIDTIV